MSKSRSIQTTRLFVALLLVWTVPALAAFPSAAAPGFPSGSPQAVPLPEQPVQLAVTLRPASGATVLFLTQNGDTVEGIPSQAFDLPHLVLYRNGALTPASERTLIVEVTGIEAPAPG